MITFIYKSFFLLFVGLIMIDPTNQLFHAKELFYFALLVFSFVFNQIRIYRVPFLLSISLLLIALVSSAVGYLFYLTEIESSITYYKALLFLGVGFIISKFSIEEILKYNYYIGVGLSLYISFLFLCMTTGVFDVSAIIDTSKDANNTIMMAPRSLLGIPTLMFFYKTMPFCFFALIYALRRNYYISVIIISFSILIGGSRTPMLMGISLIVWVLYNKQKLFSKTFIIFVFLFGMVCLLTLLTSSEYEDDGDNIKYQTVKDLLSISSFFPHGVGAQYWSSGRGEIVSNSEMTYFEMLYQYGYFLFPFVIYLFISPFFKLFRKQSYIDVKDFAVSYLLYLINAGTNPLLINSTGIYVYACALIIMAKVKESIKKQQMLQ